MGRAWKQGHGNSFDRMLLDESVDAVGKWNGRKKRRRGKRSFRRTSHSVSRPPDSASREQWRLFYKSYIHSIEWGRKRQQAFEYHGRVCNRCGATRRLQVHHRNYHRIGDEAMDDLEVLCEDCHRHEHR